MPRAVLNAVQCPVCLVGEHHPNLSGRRLILARQVEVDGVWYSQCLVCAGFWDKNLKQSIPTYNEQRGWFPCGVGG